MESEINLNSFCKTLANLTRKMKDKNLKQNLIDKDFINNLKKYKKELNFLREKGILKTPKYEIKYV